FIASATGICAIPFSLSTQANVSLALVSRSILSRRSCCGSFVLPGRPCSRGCGGNCCSSRCFCVIAARIAGIGVSCSATYLVSTFNTGTQITSAIRIVNARYTRYRAMVPISMSRGSKVTSECTGAPFVSWPRYFSVLMICDGLREFRFAQRQQRLLLQLAGKKPKPDSAQPEHRDQRQDSRRETGKNAGRKLRLGQPEQIQATHRNQPHGDLG